jgi:hypothetical protein
MAGAELALGVVAGGLGSNLVARVDDIEVKLLPDINGDGRVGTVVQRRTEQWKQRARARREACAKRMRMRTP